jgi:hypothetical protein
MLLATDPPSTEASRSLVPRALDLQPHREALKRTILEYMSLLKSDLEVPRRGSPQKATYAVLSLVPGLLAMYACKNGVHGIRFVLILFAKLLYRALRSAPETREFHRRCCVQIISPNPTLGCFCHGAKPA